MFARSIGPKLLLIAVLAGAFGTVHGCTCSTDTNDGLTTGQGGSGNNGTGGQGFGGILFSGSNTGGSTPQCVNLECNQQPCSGGATTSLSGTVYDPSGTLPIYDVIVYVPNAPLDPIVDQLSCDQCDTSLSGSPLVAAITDTQGRFTLTNVPVGVDFTLVMQIGKWRREVPISAVTACVDTPLTDPQVTRLPKSSAEGHLPRIALTTGSADPLFCLLRRLGIDDSEYGIEGSNARIHFYKGATGADAFDAGFGSSPGATFPDAPTTLWTDGWTDYDIVMLSCEASTQPGSKNNHRTALRDYINGGGRVFATHYHYNWFEGDAPADLQGIATFSGTQNNFTGLVDIDMTFPKGVALADWLDFVDGASPYGQFNVVDGRRHTQTTSADARIWVRYTGDTVYFSFNAPIGFPEDQQCGRMVFSDIHVSAGAGSATADFPGGCSNNPLSEQEKALIFMLFDLSACLIPDNQTPCPPGQANCGQPGDPQCIGQCINSCCQEIIQ